MELSVRSTLPTAKRTAPYNPLTMPSIQAKSIVLNLPDLTSHIARFLPISTTGMLKSTSSLLFRHIQCQKMSFHAFCTKMNTYTSLNQEQLETHFRNPDPFLKDLITTWCAFKHFRPHSFGKSKTITRTDQVLEALQILFLRIKDFNKHIKFHFDGHETHDLVKQEGDAHLSNSMIKLSSFASHLNFIRKSDNAFWQIVNIRNKPASATNLAVLSHMQTQPLLLYEINSLINENKRVYRDDPEASPHNNLEKLQITDTETPVPFIQKMLPSFVKELTLTNHSSSKNISTLGLKKLWVENFSTMDHWTLGNPMATVQLTSRQAKATLSNMAFAPGQSGLKNLLIKGPKGTSVTWSGTASESALFKNTASLVLENVSIQKTEQNFINKFAQSQSKSIKEGFFLLCDNVAGLKSFIVTDTKGVYKKATLLFRNIQDLTSIVVNRKYRDFTLKVENCPNLESINVADSSKVKGYIAPKISAIGCQSLFAENLTNIATTAITEKDVSNAKHKFQIKYTSRSSRE